MTAGAGRGPTDGRPMHVVHLTSSTFFGGPERQMLGLAQGLRGRAESFFLSFGEDGKCEEFLAEARRRAYFADRLQHDTPYLLAALNELKGKLTELDADVLLCHGYKAILLGRRAARRLNIPVVAVSRGWTGESWWVQLYEKLERRELKHFDQVVCVSAGQAEKVRACGVADDRLTTIRNAARLGAFPSPSPAGRAKLESFAASSGDYLIVTGARLSPDKGINVLIEAAHRVMDHHPGARFIVFGSGPERHHLEQLIAMNDLGHAFALAGFSEVLDHLLPNADLMVLPSLTEGLPNIVLEASAAGVPVVATAVGGTPEAVVDSETGWLVPAEDPEQLADAVTKLLSDPGKRQRMGQAGREFVRTEFSFAKQAQQYLDLFARLGLRQPAMTRSAAA